MTTFALHNLWTYIESLALSPNDRNWLAGKLIEPLQPKAEQRNTVSAVRKKYRLRALDPDLQWLIEHPVQLTKDELADERTQ